MSQPTTCNLLNCYKLFVFDHNHFKMFLFGVDQIALSESTLQMFLCYSYAFFPKSSYEHVHCYLYSIMLLE